MGSAMKNQVHRSLCEAVEAGSTSEAKEARHAGGSGWPRFVWVLAGLLWMVAPHVTAARPLYILADSRGRPDGTPIRAYDIGQFGDLTLRAEYVVPSNGTGALGLALDSRAERLFITYESSNDIRVVNAITMTHIGAVKVEGAKSLGSIAYDHSTDLLYCMERGKPTLYAYQWDTARRELAPAPGSPFQLAGARMYSMAVDEVKGELYVGGPESSMRVYRTSDWRLMQTIPIRHPALNTAVDPIRGYLYYTGSWVPGGDHWLVRYNLVNGVQNGIPIRDESSVIGLAIDLDTGYVYLSRGPNKQGNNDLCAYSSNMNLMNIVDDIGNPTGLVIPTLPTSPVRLTKTIKSPAGYDTVGGEKLPQVNVGEEYVYSICFERGILSLTGISVVDRLPPELVFVRATDDGKSGQYDPRTHTYTWTNPSLSGGSITCLELVCRVDPSTRGGRVITNSVTLDTRETPRIAAKAEAITVSPHVFQPLRVSKTVMTGAAGGGVSITASVYAGDEVTYRIVFDNKDNGVPVQNVRVTDRLPPQMSFVRATDDRFFGRYDPTSHTYVWSYPQIKQGESNTVELVLRLDRNVAGGATLTNTVLAESDDTPPAQARVDLKVAEYIPLRLQKTLVGGATGRSDERGRPYVEAGATLTYGIVFSNPSVNKTVTDLSIIDTLPREVSFVSADGDRQYGFYDPNAHTYTWRYGALEAGREQRLNLVVQLNDNTQPETVVGNAVALTTKQTAATLAGLQVIAAARVPSGYAPLQLQKTLLSGAVGQPDDRGRFPVNAGGTLTYTIAFSNPATNRTMTDVSLVDTLPQEVSFLSADGDREFGTYDANWHTYTWRYASLAPGAERRLNLVVRVREPMDPNTVIGNSVALMAAQTATVRARTDVVVRGSSVPPVTGPKGAMYIKPDYISRTNPAVTPELMVLVYLQDGIGKDAISTTSLVLNPGDVKATGQQIFGTETEGKILCYFKTAPILAATPGHYGELRLTATGKLRDGRSFSCETKVWILK